MAKLYFRYGAMNCGKTTHLIQVAHNYEERGMKVLVIKPNIDTKGNDTIVSRLNVSRKVDKLIKKDEDIFEYIKNRDNKMNCILVDEVQFLAKEQIDQLLRITVEFNIPVICYGLRTDFKMNGFEGSERLLLLAHSIEEMKTICTCGRKATLNIRKVNGRPVFEGDKVVIDNNSKVEYISVCPQCYYDMKRQGERR